MTEATDLLPGVERHRPGDEDEPGVGDHGLFGALLLRTDEEADAEIGEADHAAGLNSTLENLALFCE